MEFSAEDFDRFLSEDFVRPEWMIMHPAVWTGYWSIKYIPAIVRHIAKWAGKLFHIRPLMWVGLPLYWVEGLSIYFPNVEAEFVENYDE